jgi:dTDP-4-amino-4,6-dideoxygalactose transaminase
MKIWLSPPHLSGKEKQYINEAIDSGWITSIGPQIKQFEGLIARHTELDYQNVQSVSTGTAGLHLALLSQGVKAGDRVACSSLTFAATANAIKYIGAHPVFIDSEADTWNMDPELLKDAILDGLETQKPIKAVIVVNIFGMPFKVPQINNICLKYQVPLIEDAAESLGSRYRNIPSGKLADISVFSFNGNKILTTSGGGAVVSTSSTAIERVRFLSTQAKEPVDWYQHEEIGYNYRMSNILAAIGIAQMEVLEDRVNTRRVINYQYREFLEGLPIKFHSEPTTDYKSNYWLTCVIFEDHKTMIRVHRALKDAEIESRRIWKPMHIQPVFVNEDKYTNGISEDLFNRGLSLPSGSQMTKKDIQKITDIIKKCLVLTIK